MWIVMDNSVQLVYYYRKFDAGYYPQTETFKIWNNWYDEHKYRLEKLKSNPHY